MSVYQKIDVLTGLAMLKDLAEKHPNKLQQDYGKWQGENLILRISLLNYLIKRVSNHNASTYSTLEIRG